MTKIKSTLIVIGILSLLFTACKEKAKKYDAPVHNKAIQTKISPFLISIHDADSLIHHAENLAILDVRKVKRFEEGHLPGAQQIYRPDYESDTFPYKGMHAEKEKLEHELGIRGIDSSTLILLYDEHGNVDAARLWWILLQFGHKKIRLIDGGYTAWTLAGNEISRETHQAEKKKFHFPHEFDNSLNIYRKELLTLLKDSSIVIIDTRSDDEYNGTIIKNGALKGGHIPGAIHEDYIYCLRYDSDYTFLSPDSLRNIFESLGIGPDSKIITYCHSGVRSALSLFVLREILGYSDVRNYDGSWIEWTHFEDSPIESKAIKKEL